MKNFDQNILEENYFIILFTEIYEEKLFVLLFIV
jgi:hypothetical protein